MIRAVVVLALAASCGSHPDIVEPSPPSALPPHRTAALDTTPKQHKRMVPPEVFLRAYLTWFGGLAPDTVQRRVREGTTTDLFDQWRDYLSAIGLPDYRIDSPRSEQSNTIMLATFGRLGEALCVKAVEHDLRSNMPEDQRLIFAFDVVPNPSLDDFRVRFDILHRTFLGYPVSLAARDRVDKFFAVYRAVVARHAGNSDAALDADETGWVAMCTALIQHPEAELY